MCWLDLWKKNNREKYSNISSFSKSLLSILHFFKNLFEVIPADEHAAKIAAAREVIGDSDFFLVARTDARSTHDLSEAISRANLYLEVLPN